MQFQHEEWRKRKEKKKEKRHCILFDENISLKLPIFVNVPMFICAKDKKTVMTQQPEEKSSSDFFFSSSASVRPLFIQLFFAFFIIRIFPVMLKNNHQRYFKICKVDGGRR